MAIDFSLFNKIPAIDTVSIELKNGRSYRLDILRLDALHNTISGNKWFKLKYNLLAAQEQGASSILSFGGAYSNHLHALAYAGKLFGLRTIGIVRGEAVINPTLRDCQEWGMELRFIPRSAYRNKTDATFLTSLKKEFSNTFIIPEGGDNALGQKGCTEIMSGMDAEKYDTLCCSIGTGTTIQGLASNFPKDIIGFAPFKNALSLKEKLIHSIPQLNYIDNYHFGGFGKANQDLLNYMDSFKEKHHINLDRVYTAKMFWGIENELNQNSAWHNRTILVVHTGGLQGNRSSNS